VISDNATAINVSNNSYDQPTMTLTNGLSGQVLNITGTSSSLPLAEISNTGEASTLKLSNPYSESGLSGTSLEVASGKSSFAGEVLHNVSGPENAISVYSEKYGLNLLAGNAKVSGITMDGTALVGGVVNLNLTSYFTLYNFTNNPTPFTAGFAVTLPNVLVANDLGRILVIANGTNQIITVPMNNATPPTIAAYHTMTLICIGDNLWAVTSTGTIPMPD
jgi:hypothetical protein